MTGFPRQFGSYILLRPLARGGMGALYLALSGVRETAKLCVIKTVLPHLADKEYLARFRDEAKVVVRLSHGNLVPVFDSGQVEGEIYLAMDFVEGKDLRNTWNRCAKKGIAFPIDVAAHIVKELARGLHYAHTFGDIKLVHRDVSPPNVLLSYSGEVRLTDFGLASSTLKLEKTAPGIIYGKVSYMSPEQARGEPLDGRTDLYAAGIILWELLTGRQVFPSTKPGPAGQDAPADELLTRVRHPQVVPPSKKAARVPAELDRIAMKALAPDLVSRYANCEELRQDLAAFLAQTAPATDGVRVAKFLRDLYDDDIESERMEREALMNDVLGSFGSSSASPPASAPGPDQAKAKSPPPSVTNGAPGVGPPRLPGQPPPLRLPHGKTSLGAGAPAAAAAVAATEPTPTPPPVAASDSEVRARRERGTVVAGPARAGKRVGNKTDLDPPSSEPASVSSSLLQSNPSAAARSAVVGSVIGGRYQVRRLSGEGGMGRVYEAEHIDIGKRVALKILHPAYSQTPDLVERLRREARAASKISHPNVVDVTDSGTTDDGAFFFVMEYIEGIELGELIFREKRLDVARSLSITAQVCRALQAAHDVHVIHRDLKPENVLILSRDGQKDFVKVLDFGIAKSPEREDKDGHGQPSRRLTHPGMTMGTPEYMAPEQAAGKPADPRSDIYAVGGILYEMLSGEPPYDGNNFMEILHKKASQSPAPLSTFRTDVPAEIEALIMRTLAKDPAERPQSMTELEQEIQRLLGAHFPNLQRTERGLAPLRTPRPLFETSTLAPITLGGIATRVRGWGRRKQLFAGAGGVVALVAIFALIFGAGRKRMAPPPTAPVVAAPAPIAPPPPPAAPVEASTETPSDPEPAPPRTEPEPEAAPAPRAAKAARTATADNRKLLDEGERLLRAERFVEAREIFTKLAKSRRDKGAALVGLAEIAFQEKHYSDAVRSAKLAAGAGGGVRARVLLGDAHFRLNQYKEAAKAYEDALKLDPGNASARGGLSLANKRM